MAPPRDSGSGLTYLAARPGVATFVADSAGL